MEYSVPVSSVELAFTPTNPDQPMLVESVVPIEETEPRMTVISSTDLFDLSFSDQMVAVNDNTIDIALTSSTEFIDAPGSVTFTPINAETVTVRSIPSEDIIVVSVFSVPCTDETLL